MKVEWNKVTWYSKLMALVLFVVLPFAGFYLGMQYGKAKAFIEGAGAYCMKINRR